MPKKYYIVTDCIQVPFQAESLAASDSSPSILTSYSCTHFLTISAAHACTLLAFQTPHTLTCLSLMFLFHAVGSGASPFGSYWTLRLLRAAGADAVFLGLIYLPCSSCTHQMYAFSPSADVGIYFSFSKPSRGRSPAVAPSALSYVGALR